MKHQVFIDGGEGTTGLKIHEYFQSCEDIEVLTIQEEKRKDVKHRLEMIESAHVSFLCLPDDAAREIAALAPKDAKLIDTSTAHRTREDWVYGLPELTKDRREEIRKSNRVAVPGCHATGIILLTRPLVDNEIISRNYPLWAVSLTGYSGGGKKMISAYRSESRSETLDSPGIYGLTQNHKHLREIVAMTGLEKAPIFHPIVGDYFSGMAVTISLHRDTLNGEVGKSQLAELFSSRYEEETLIKVMETPEEQGFLYGNSMKGRNDMEIYISGNDERISLTAIYDNLGKGASGAAIQNMNMMLGIEETHGLI